MASSVTILIVDDLSDMRTLMNLTLKRNGWNVLEARDGQEAIDVARQHQPTIVVMDYDMPTKNGAEACREITSDPSTAHIPVIVYTGHASAHIKEESYKAGAKQFLVKPITPSQMRQEIQNLLNGSNLDH
ncbi:MAG: response regulator [Chloroflexi bacterium]|nr:response regulator [Chloroflexota bacterium]